MPIVTLIENDQARYYAVTEGNEASPECVVSEYKLAERSTREYAEHELRVEYLRRLTEHAYECALLDHLSRNPPDEDDLIGNLKLLTRLAAKVAKDALWLRTYDPFTGLIAEVVDDDKNSTMLEVGSVRVNAIDDDSWEATDHALWKRSPLRRDRAARNAQAAERKYDYKDIYTPAGAKRVEKASDELAAAMKYAKKLNERRVKRASTTKARRAG